MLWLTCIILILSSRHTSHILKQFVPGRLTSPDTFTLSQSNPSNQTEQQQQPDNILVFRWIFIFLLKHQNVPLVLIRCITPLKLRL